MSAALPLRADATLEEIRATFARDRFAMGLCGIEIDEARYGHAVCSFTIDEKHLNLQDRVMGGALFTLADFCLAVISNVGEAPSSSVHASIDYLSAAKGKRLIATARTDKSGRNLGFYTVDVEDDLGTPVARMIATVFRHPTS